MWEDIAVKIGLKAVEKFFDGIGKQETDVISIGLAVGYYYNFLDPVSQVMKMDALTLYSDAKGGEGRKFQAEDVGVQVIVPQRLDVATFDRCEQEFKGFNKGFILIPTNNRYYGINYALTELPSKTTLTIVDLARPVMSVKRYYEDILNFKTYDDTDEKWTKIQFAELAAFKEALRRLQKRGYGGLVNKLDFRERS